MKYKNTIVELIYYILEALISILLFKKVILLFIILLLFLIIGIIFIYDKKDKYIILVAVCVGFLGEILCIKLGIWSYNYTYLLSWPLWLPIAWGNAGIVIYRLSNVIYNKLNNT